MIQVSGTSVDIKQENNNRPGIEGGNISIEEKLVDDQNMLIHEPTERILKCRFKKRLENHLKILEHNFAQHKADLLKHIMESVKIDPNTGIAEHKEERSYMRSSGEYKKALVLYAEYISVIGACKKLIIDLTEEGLI